VPEREGIRDTLNRIVSMMGGDDLEAAAVLSSSPAAQSRAEVKDVLHAGETDLTLIAELASDLDVDVDDSVD
jgi:hypothetical protein